jgi:hypothetical protein
MALVDHRGRSAVQAADRRYPSPQVSSAQLNPAGGHARARGDGLRINDDASSNQRAVNVAQGVHDALNGDASQLPPAQGHVEPLTRRIERLSIVDTEANASALVGRERGAGGSDTLAAGIEGIHRGSVLRGHHRQPPLATSNIQHPRRIERHQLENPRCLDPGSVTHVHVPTLRLVVRMPLSHAVTVRTSWEAPNSLPVNQRGGGYDFRVEILDHS